MPWFFFKADCCARCNESSKQLCTTLSLTHDLKRFTWQPTIYADGGITLEEKEISELNLKLALRKTGEEADGYVIYFLLSYISNFPKKKPQPFRAALTDWGIGYTRHGWLLQQADGFPKNLMVPGS